MTPTQRDAPITGWLVGIELPEADPIRLRLRDDRGDAVHIEVADDWADDLAGPDGDPSAGPTLRDLSQQPKVTGTAKAEHGPDGRIRVLRHPQGLALDWDTPPPPWSRASDATAAADDEAWTEHPATHPANQAKAWREAGLRRTSPAVQAGIELTAHGTGIGSGTGTASDLRAAARSPDPRIRREIALTAQLQASHQRTGTTLWLDGAEYDPATVLAATAHLAN